MQAPLRNACATWLKPGRFDALAALTGRGDLLSNARLSIITGQRLREPPCAGALLSPGPSAAIGPAPLEKSIMSVNHQSMANAVRALAMDAVEKAKSGHPGLPMGAAD